jgi:hypothetical protein
MKSKSVAQEGEESIREHYYKSFFPQKIVSARIVFIALPEKISGKKRHTRAHTETQECASTED